MALALKDLQQIPNAAYPTPGLGLSLDLRGKIPPQTVPFIGARVFNSAAISAANGAFTVLTFDSERFDTDNIHDLASNTSRLTVKTAGKYRIYGNVEFASAAGGAFRLVGILLNGATSIAEGGSNGATIVAGPNVRSTVCTTYDLALNDYVELRVFQDSGGALNVNASGNYSPEFGMERVG